MIIKVSRLYTEMGGKVDYRDPQTLQPVEYYFKVPDDVAERDVIEGEDRVFRQEELMALMRSQGQNTAEAEALLRVLRETLLVWKAHRDQILRTIASLET